MTTALVLIDLQEDYFQDGELARCRDDLVVTCNALIDRAHEAQAPVVEVRTVHSHDRRTWALNMLEDGQGMALAGTPGAERLPGLEPADHVVVKTRDSAFHRTDLADLLSGLEVGRLVLAGVSTESCISATAVDAYAHDLEVVLVEDATASTPRPLHEQTLDRLRAQYRQEVLSSGEVDFRAEPRVRRQPRGHQRGWTAARRRRS